MRTTIVVCLIAVMAVALLGGCSGAGAPATELRGGAVSTLAVDNLSAFAVVSSWVALLYPKPSGDTYTYNEETIIVDGVPVNHRWGTLTDGGQFDYLVNPDNSSRGTITWPDGRVLRESSGRPEWEGAILTQAGETVFPDGARLSWQTRMDTSVNSSPQVTTGSAVSAKGATMTYRWRREQLAHDEVAIALPDGSAVNLQCPLTSQFGSTYWPRFAQGMDGSFKAAGGAELDFHMSGQGNRWDRWTMDNGQGGIGAIVLDEQMAGAGQVWQDGKLAGGVRWTDALVGALDVLGGKASPVWPSAAARDFQMTRWVSNLAALGPTPVY